MSYSNLPPFTAGRKMAAIFDFGGEVSKYQPTIYRRDLMSVGLIYQRNLQLGQQPACRWLLIKPYI